MEAVGFLHGNAPVIKKYQVAASLTLLGVPHIAAAAATAGLAVATTTSIANMVGINLDLATYGTAQVAGSTPEALASFIINPDVILKILLSGGATAGTAAVYRDVTTASATGLAVTTGDDWSSPTTDEGQIWGIDGANVGQIRKITSVSSTAATVTVAFANDTVVGDNFMWAPCSPMAAQTIKLTTDLTEWDQSAAVAANECDFQLIEIPVNDFLFGPKRPYGLFVPADHILKRGP